MLICTPLFQHILRSLVLTFMLVSSSLSSSAFAYEHLSDSAALVMQKEYQSLEEALKEPAKVVRLNLKGRALKAVPPEVLNLPNLQALILWNN